jgi:predicted kinase
MCGLSGSGKSYVATRLVPHLGALRLRSDVLRKAQAGLAREARSGSALDQGLYAAERVDAVYATLADLAVLLLQAGETVILDATFLSARRRQTLLEAARVGKFPAVVLYCHASLEILRNRVGSREATGDDASEAGLPVLEAQRQRFEEPEQPEPVMRVDTGADVDVANLAARLDAVRNQAASGGSPSPA